MSLNHRERMATAEELRANLELSGLSIEQVQTALNMTAAQLQAVLTLAGANPADVWRLRDHLEQVIRERGGTPAPYTSLTPKMRESAARWFGLPSLEGATDPGAH